MGGNKGKSLTIIIGGDMEADFKELLSSKQLKEIKQPKNTLYLESFEQLDKLLSPKRMDLLRYLMEKQSSKKPKSVSKIALELDRHQEAISRDVNYLKNLGLIVLKHSKQTAFAFPKHKQISIKVC